MIQKKRSKYKAVTIPVCFLVILLLFARPGQGSVRLRGIVVDKAGKPVKGAKITAVYWTNPLVKKEEIHKRERRSEPARDDNLSLLFGIPMDFLEQDSWFYEPDRNLPQARRETHSDKQGNWGIYFVRKGNWRITAYTDEKMSFPVFVTVQDDTPEINLKLDMTSTDILIAVKRIIYKRNFKKAIEFLKWFKVRFPGSRNLENSLYWLAYCQYKLSEQTRKDREMEKIGTEAIKNLDELIKNFPKGEWADDAKILRIEFAQKLVKLGEDKYKKYIMAAVQSTERTEFDVKIAALSALITIDKEKAIQHLIDIIKKEADAQVRKKAIFILATNKVAGAIPVIKKVAEKDKDESVRTAASSWLHWLENTTRR